MNYCLSVYKDYEVYSLLGFEVVIVESKNAFSEAIKLINNKPDIIVIDEVINNVISEIRNDYEESVYPIFICIPRKSSDSEKERFKELVSRAIGVDIN
jgi:vacuolar-type H+-ATPase subunit F/Vma7